MKPYFIQIIRILLILLWTYAAASKLIEFQHFRHEMENQVFPLWLSAVLIYVVPAVELVAASLLTRDKMMMGGMVLSGLLLMLFTGYVLLVYIHVFNRVPCSCGGILGHLKWGPHLIFNTIFLMTTTSAIVIIKKERRAAWNRW